MPNKEFTTAGLMDAKKSVLNAIAIII